MTNLQGKFISFSYDHVHLSLCFCKSGEWRIYAKCTPEKFNAYMILQSSPPLFLPPEENMRKAFIFNAY